MFDYAASDSVLVLTHDGTLTDEALAQAEKLESDPSTPSESDLENWRVRDDQLAFDAALSANLPVADIDASFSRRVMVRDVARYTERTAGSSLQQWGVSIRLVVTVWSGKVEGKLTLPMVAAQAQLGIVNTSAELQVLGFRSNKVGKLLPRFEAMDVNSYSEYTRASDKIRDLISESSQDIIPVILKSAGNPGSSNTQLTKSVGTARALHYLARRRPLGEALNGVQGWPDLAEVIRTVYKQFANSTDEGIRPGAEPAEQAQKWAAWMGE